MIFGRAQGSRLHSAAIDFNHSVVGRFWEEAFFQELSRKLSDTQNNGIERWHSEEEQLQAVLPFFHCTSFRVLTTSSFGFRLSHTRTTCLQPWEPLLTTCGNSIWIKPSHFQLLDVDQNWKIFFSRLFFPSWRKLESWTKWIPRRSMILRSPFNFFLRLYSLSCWLLGRRTFRWLSSRLESRGTAGLSVGSGRWACTGRAGPGRGRFWFFTFGRLSELARNCRCSALLCGLAAYICNIKSSYLCRPQEKVSCIK